MGSEWSSRRLADVVEIISGGTPKTNVPEYWGGEIPWLSVADFNNGYRWVSSAEKNITERGLSESATRLLSKGDVIISARGTVGALAQLSRSMAFNQSCYGVRGKGGVSDTNFIYYFLRVAVAEMKQVVHGGVFDTITRDTFSLLELSLPPIEEQRAIAHILGTLDDKIELNRQQNKTLEEMARALFKAWFVDFEPVRAKMEGRWQRGQSLPGLPADIFDLFPDRLVESELGEIPEGWTYALSGEIYDVGIGKTPPRKESQWFSEGGINVPWLSIRDMGNCGVFAYETAESITREAVAKFNVRWIPAGTVLLSFKLTVGRIVIAECEMTSNEAIAHFKGKENSPSVNFLYCYLKSYDFSKLGSTSSIATATNSKAIRNLPIISPSKEVVNAFDSVASCLFESIKTNSQQSRTLAQLRDTLLPKLISGELRIPDKN